ncbi:MAG: MbcA/ParS/Xre antitoxin family protein [Pseudomonadota bacterium]
MDTSLSGSALDRGKITKMIMKLFDHWQLNTIEQLSLLGLSTENRAALSKYRAGNPLVNDRDKLERAGILLGIHKALRLLFPHHRELSYRWMKQPNRAFEGFTPVEIIEQKGMLGMYLVRSYLDRQRGH